MKKLDKAINTLKNVLKDCWTITTPEQEILNDIALIYKDTSVWDYINIWGYKLTVSKIEDWTYYFTIEKWG